MTLTNLEKALHDKVIAENNLKLIEDIIATPDQNPLSKAACTMYSTQLQSIQEKCDDVYRRILNTKPDDTTQYTTAFQDIFQRLMKAQVFILEKKETFQSSSSGSNQPQQSNKLPKLELPKFGGRYEDWQSFQDLFRATVTNNTHISEAEKLSYLRSCVIGEAAQLIKSFAITDAHFKEAWDLLDKRYNNKKEIIQSLVRRLINQPSLKGENATALQTLFNTTTECLRSLKVMGRDTDHWDDLVIVIITDKLDLESRAEWGRTHRGTSPPTFTEFETFMIEHIRSIHSRGNVLQVKQSQQRPTQPHTQTKQFSSHHTAPTHQCPVCNSNHAIYNCQKFIQMSVVDRVASVKANKLCMNCLKHGHLARGCSSSTGCKKCGSTHNTLLHYQKAQAQQQQPPEQPQQSKPQGATFSVSSNFSGGITGNNQTLLKTAKILITDQFGIQRECRALLDDGSQTSFITESLATSLGLKRFPIQASITGVGAATVGNAKQFTTFKIHSRINNQHIRVEAIIMPQVTSTLPSTTVYTSKEWNHLNHIQFADPDWAEPGHIDLLLGSEVTYLSMRAEMIMGGELRPTAQNTIFGWVLFGSIPVNKEQRQLHCHMSRVDLNSIVSKFWELEKIPEVRHMTKEEQETENHFSSNISRDKDGRYICRLPFNNKKQSLGESYDQAYTRFLSLEKRFKRQSNLKQPYSEFMKEYLQLNHMELVPSNEINKSASYYLPHHCVVRDESTTTKLRVVFDGSAKTSTGLSLNDTLNVGPVVQDDLFSILVRFRTNLIALKADVTKMYRQFRVPADDADYQRILWRENETDPINVYRLTSVTYGTSAAPFLATRCLQQLAFDEEHQFPNASRVIKTDSYVDDLMSGENSTPAAITLFKELTDVMTSGGMEMRKWASNSKEVLQHIPISMRETQGELGFDTDTTVKALGIRWNQHSDQFLFKVNQAVCTKLTKRVMLSELSKVFDPLGWLSPVTVNAKIMFQKLWKDKLDWDEEPNMAIQQRWNTYQSDLSILSSLKIPRCVTITEASTVELHGFCDASEVGYAAAVYYKVTSSQGETKCNLIAAKTRVAPINQESLPRLELCGAVLVTELLQSVQKAIKITCSLHAWTDSTIVLHWLSSSSGRWNTFVANRVSKIQQVLPRERWNHVKSEQNPADCASRGIFPSELINFRLWWNGPPFLHTTTIDPAECPKIQTDQLNLEERKNCHLSTTCQQQEPAVLYRYSSLTKLKRVISYVLRFIYNSKRNHSHERRKGELTVEELDSATTYIIKSVQQASFKSEQNSLAKQEGIKDSSLNQLNPFIDKYGVMRVGGRLSKAPISEDMKHPIILPHNHHVTTLVIRDAHDRTMHGGLQLTLSTITQQYWIIRGRDQVRHAIRKCVKCRRQRAKLSQQLMGNLPSPRVTPSRPFTECGVDYAGPYLLKSQPGRGQRTVKCWFSIFVCLSTKAIHLEVVTSLSTEEFLACFKRFSARRGIPKTFYSDCGTTFIGAEREMKLLLSSSHHNSIMQQELTQQGTNWVFNPPAAPHQGGLWEAGVKSVKYHLRRVIGSNTPSVHEFVTLLCMVEACVNSRPLCGLSSDPSDYNALTPGHFLIGAPLNSIPEPDLTRIKENRLSRWQQMQRLFQHFWARWKGEYLTTLQQRFKWKSKRENLEVDDLVIIKDDNLPPMRWKMGRVSAVHKGQDGLVRVVTVKTSSTELQRPVTKLCPLISKHDN